MAGVVPVDDGPVSIAGGGVDGGRSVVDSGDHATVVDVPMMPSVHPRMSKDMVGTGIRRDSTTTATDASGDVKVAAPGIMGSNWGGVTPAGLVIGHVVHGTVVALLYTWIG